MSERIIRESVSGPQAKELLLSGVNMCADIVGDTMGYFGNNNLFETTGGMPFITADGWDSLEQLHFENPVEAMASEVVKEAARKTRDEVGDQTTTTTVLTQAFFQNSLEALKSGKHSIQIKKDTEESVAAITKYIEDISEPVDDKLIYDIAKTSAHGDDAIASIVQEAFMNAGEYGVVTHKRAFTNDTTIEHIDGVLVESGFANDNFINVPETQSVVYDNPFVLCSEVLFETPDMIIPFMEFADKAGKALVVISPMTHQVTSVVLANYLEGFKFVVVNPPLSGKMRSDALSDLALVCGGRMITGLDGVMFKDKAHMFLGTASRVEVTDKRTVVTHCESVSQEPAKGKIDELTNSLKSITGLYEKNSVKERISKLAGKISTIKVGGHTDSEVEERLARMEDAIMAVKSAKEEGVVAGGGITLRNAAIELDIDDITIESITAPFERIIENAGLTQKVSNEEELTPYPFGYDVRTGEVTDLFKAGVLDSAKGIRCSLINAVSASNNLLRTNHVITLKRQK